MQLLPTLGDIGNNMAARKTGSRNSYGCIADRSNSKCYLHIFGVTEFSKCLEIVLLLTSGNPGNNMAARKPEVITARVTQLIET
jgi:hypothetical protein